jgi:hypothetical protein
MLFESLQLGDFGKPRVEAVRLMEHYLEVQKKYKDRVIRPQMDSD